MPDPVLLDVEAVFKRFPLRRPPLDALLGRPRRHVQAANGISLRLHAGESFGLVGESGCGKTTLGRMVLGLLPPDDGMIAFEGQDLARLGPAARRVTRRRMQMIFQDPYASLNPRLRVGVALAEPLRLHRVVPSGQVDAEVTRLLTRVGLPAEAARRYPGELSGGQRQRVGIARALALRPRLLVADEAVSGLDVSVRAQVLNLLDDLRRELGLSLLFISHDLGVIDYLCDAVAVMYLGTMVESGPTASVFARAAHPYTAALLRAVPRPDPEAAANRPTPLEGEPPSPVDPPSGCAFRTRCPHARPVCSTIPPRVELPGFAHSRVHWAACHFARDLAGPPEQ